VDTRPDHLNAADGTAAVAKLLDRDAALRARETSVGCAADAVTHALAVEPDSGGALDELPLAELGVLLDRDAALVTLSDDARRRIAAAAGLAARTGMLESAPLGSTTPGRGRLVWTALGGLAAAAAAVALAFTLSLSGAPGAATPDGEASAATAGRSGVSQLTLVQAERDADELLALLALFEVESASSAAETTGTPSGGFDEFWNDLEALTEGA